MKKVLTMALALTMIFSTCMTVFAEGFLESPSNNQAPQIVDFSAESDDCEAEMVVTPYSQRDTLSEEFSEDMLEAYNDIKNADDLTTLTPELEALARQRGVLGEYLSVSDLFSISFQNCEPSYHESENHGRFSIKLSAETLGNFFALMQKTESGWKVIDNATVNGNILSFYADSSAPFAVVVETSSISPQTEDNTSMYIFGVLAILSLGLVVICLRKYRIAVTGK